MNKKNIIWIAILAVLIVVFMLSKGRENFERRIDLFKFSSADVTKIEFVTPADTLIIAWEQGKWMITHPNEAPVNMGQLETFFEHYLSLTTSKNPVSESIERQIHYNVEDETAIQIMLYGRNNRLLSKIFYGMSLNNRSIAYIRKDNDNMIYQINNIIQIIAPFYEAWEGEEIIEEEEFMFGDMDLENLELIIGD